jgi:PAS domain S-box-containing protein
MNNEPPHESRFDSICKLKVPVLVFLFSTVVILAASHIFYQYRSGIVKKSIQTELSAIADLKAEEIIRWRSERFADAEVLRTDPFLCMMLERHLKTPEDSEARAHLERLLSKIVTVEGYSSAALVDTSGNIRLATPNCHALCETHEVDSLFHLAIREQRVITTDLHRIKGEGHIHFTFFAPVVRDSLSQASGAIVLDINPDEFLFPLIQTWPIPSTTAEELLVRRDGDSVLFLNELRHRKNTALRLRLPMSNDLPAARTISGFRGVMEGHDYRNVPVLAAAREIPGTTWFMISKMDRSEALAPVNNLIRNAAILSILLILITGVLVVLFQRHHTSGVYKKYFYAEREKNDLTASLALSEERFYRLFASMTEGVALHELLSGADGSPSDYRILNVNPAYERHTGLASEKVTGVLASELYGTGTPPFLEVYARVAGTGEPHSFEIFFPPMNKHFAISVFSPGKNLFATVFEDVTARKLSDNEREATIRLLSLLNAKNSTHDLMNSVTVFLKNWSGCEAIGIRLRDGEDYPYFETHGFPEEFVALENSLCARNMQGQIVRNNFGNPVIECMCGNVIEGRIDSSKSFFTKKGSFWSNNTTELLASTTDADRQARTRNRCNGEGYVSVALIRLKFGDIPLGLIQINDKRPDRFSLVFIEQVERFAESISIALDQRRVQAQLAEERERLMVTLRSIGDGVIATDAAGNILLLNDVAEVLTGWMLKDAEGKPLTEVFRIINEKTRQTCENPVEKVIATGNIIGLANHTALISRDGTEHSIADSAAPIRNNEGKTIGVVLVFRDITGKYQAEERLRQSEERFRNIFEQGRFGIVIVSKSFRFEKVNPAFCDLLGYTEPELQALTFKDITHPDYIEGDLEHVKAIAEGKSQVYCTDKQYLHKNGDMIWSSVTITAIRNSKDEFLYFVAMIQDITDRKKAENALITEKERLTVTLRSIGDAVIATDTFGHITLMNKVAETLTGWSLSEALGRPLSDVFVIINEQTRQPCENPVDRVMRSGAIVMLQNHTMLLNREGGEIVISDSGAPIRDRDSVIIGVVLVFRDDTEKQRTRDTMRKAEQLESLGVLAGGIAHDFNNLLGGLFGYIDMARDGIRSDHEAIRNLDKAFSVFGRAKDLTSQLLTFAKGGAPARKTKSLPPLINDTVRFALSGSVVKAEFFIDPGLKPCDIDENQMSQVLDNITINARDAMPRGGTITVSAVNLTSDTPLPPILKAGPYIRVSVSDQGTGIAQDHIVHIFDPFFTTKQKGSGLGLAVCYSIIKRHDGTLEVESQLGKGSTFHIYLPVSTKAVSTELSSSVTNIHKGSGRILVMDDEDYIRDIAGTMLSDMGYEVSTATCGEEAIELFSEAQKTEKPFHLVILDLTVPGGMGGKEAKDCIRKIMVDVKIVASSGYSEDPVIAYPANNGFDASLMKPYKKAELAETVRRVLRDVTSSGQIVL